MAVPTLTEAATAAGGRIGRYFSVVSVVPAALLVVFVLALVQSGAWAGPPDWSRAARSAGRTSLAAASILALVTLGVALAMHPLQFTMTQLLEGYWGGGPVAERLMTSRRNEHRRRRRELKIAQDDAIAVAEAVPRGEWHGDRGDRQVGHEVVAQEAGRLLGDYPQSPRRVMPTRLGNALRRYEDQAGSAYGLGGVTVAPHVALVAPPGQVAYLEDRRVQLDVAVRMCVVSLLAAAAAVLFLWSDGAWLLCALPPYGLAYLFYRGAVGPRTTTGWPCAPWSTSTDSACTSGCTSRRRAATAMSVSTTSGSCGSWRADMSRPPSTSTRPTGRWA